MHEVEFKQMIITRLTRRGAGVVGDPIRIITQFFDTDGALVGECDPCTYSPQDMISFGRFCSKPGQTVSGDDIEMWEKQKDQR